MGSNERTDRLQRRNEKIRKRYAEMREVRENGVRMYSEEYILHKLSEEFFLAPATIDDIVCNRK